MGLTLSAASAAASFERYLGSIADEDRRNLFADVLLEARQTISLWREQLAGEIEGAGAYGKSAA